MKKAILAAVVLLTGCQTASGPEEIPLADLLISDGTNIQRYVDVIGETKEPEWWMKGLPLPQFQLHIASVSKQARWMLDFNFDGDYTLSRAEMTQAWLVQTARWKTGIDYAPNSLMAMPKTAALELTQVSPQALSGVAISVDDERAVRSVVDGLAGGAAATEATRTAAQAAVQDAVDAANVSVGAAGGGDGGGGASGGGSDGGSSGSSGGTGGVGGL